ncbi:MAG: CpaF family protein [Actinomycetota bacterium]
MKLSERLAALEEQERKQEPGADLGTSRPTRPGRHRARAAATPKAKKDNASWEESKRKVRALVLAEVAPKMGKLKGDALNAELKGALDRILQRQEVQVSPLERRKFVQEVIQDTLGYGPLDPLLQDVNVTEIMCNGFDEIWVEKRGRLEATELSFTDDVQYRQVIEKIVSAVGRRIDESSPMVDARLPDGSRVNAIIPPLAIHGSVLTIRKFAADPYTVKDLINFGTFSLDLAVVMEACVRGKLNILVSGGTGTGKTTNLNVLSSFVPDGERIITIEDSAELQLQQPHVINLESRPPNAEGVGEVRIRDLVKNSLRMRPDRIIVGEVRGAEALDMLQAMNTGHEGSMTTVHANSARDALSRLETMVLMAGFDLPVRAIREQVNAAIDVIMHLDRRSDGRRVVTSVTEVQGMEGDVILLQEIFRWRPGMGADGKPSGELVATGLRPKFLEKLADAGVEVPAKVFQSKGTPRAVPERPGRTTRVPRPRDLAELERAR